MNTDEKFMRRCLQLAQNGRNGARPNPMVGAVIVVPWGQGEARIIGEGYHVRCGEGHAEVNAFASVRPEDEHLLPEATMYVSLEPCSHYGKTPPCADLIIKKGVRRVVVGCQDDFSKVQGRGIQKLREAGICVTVGVLEQECRWLNRRFFTFHREHRPYIILKWAQTANGFIDDDGRALKISSDFTQMLCHKLRSEADAIAVGRITNDREHPQLNVRHWSTYNGQRSMFNVQWPTFNVQCSMFNVQWSMVNGQWSMARQPRRIVLSHDHPLDLNGLYADNVQSLIVEGGAKTLQSFLDSSLWDELRVETNLSLTVPKGTPAPLIPPNAKVIGKETYGDNIITHYYNM